MNPPPMTTNSSTTGDALSSIEDLEREASESHELLQDSHQTPAGLDHLVHRLARLEEAYSGILTAVTEAQVQSELLIAARSTQEQQFADMLKETHSTEAHRTREWETFRTKAEAEQKQVLRAAVMTRQELGDRLAQQEALVASLNERLGRMNQSLANMVSDLQDTRRHQKRLAILLTIAALLALGLSAVAFWYAFA